MSIDFCEDRFFRVPDESRLRIETTSQDNSLFLNGTLHDEASNEVTTWTHERLFNKIVTRRLHSGKRYRARVNVAFIGNTNATVDVQMSVVKPNGKIRGPLICTFSGKMRDAARAKLRIFMSRE